MVALTLIAAATVAAGLWLLAKRSPPAALLIVCALGGLLQTGTLRTPLNAPAERAAESVQDAQRRLSERIACRMLLVAALASQDPTELDAVQDRCEHVWGSGDDRLRLPQPRWV